MFAVKQLLSLMSKSGTTSSYADDQMSNQLSPCFIDDKKSQLMLTRRTKAYSSSCLQTVSLSPAILSQFILRVCAAAKNRKYQ